MNQHHVFIATSLDGYIADADGGVGFLDTFPMPEGDDMGYYAFMAQVDALLMGRKSFETVLSFGVEWPYAKPVFVWSQTLDQIPEELAGKAELVRGTLEEVEALIQAKGYQRFYLDGGQVIQSFLRADKVGNIDHHHHSRFNRRWGPTLWRFDKSHQLSLCPFQNLCEWIGPTGF